MKEKFYRNPFPQEDRDRHNIWKMLVERAVQARCRKDWKLIENDFQVEGFIGIDAGGLVNPDSWRLRFANLLDYRDDWDNQNEFYHRKYTESDSELTLLRLTTLQDIDINGDRALAHRKQDGF